MASAALTVCLSSSAWSAHTSSASRRVIAFEEEGGGGGRKCHTALPGESCHVDVEWAMKTGMKDHPEWYTLTCAWLKPNASFEEFQACVFKINETTCPLPCNPKGSVPQRVIKTTHSNEKVPEKRQRAADDSRRSCHIAKRGEVCYDAVVKAMLTGVGKIEDSGLTESSSFEEIQTVLHKVHEDSECPRPCPCRTVAKGETCHAHVVWALQEGIRQRPAWYIGLTVNSSLQEVQAYLHKDAKGTCPLPCSTVTQREIRQAAALLPAGQVAALQQAAGDSSSKEEEALQKPPKRKQQQEEEEEEQHDKQQEHQQQQQHDEQQHDEQQHATSEASSAEAAGTGTGAEKDHCHTADIGEKCYDGVMYALQSGIFDHPEWYPGLDAFSSFEEYQAVIHERNPDLECLKPCACTTAKVDDDCYKKVKWVLHEGIPRHPDWYPGLNEQSRWETVQARLHEDENTTCGKPCTPKPRGKPSLFCIAVFRSAGYELGLVKSQMDKGVGIFACDEFAVLSDKELNLTSSMKTLMIPPCEKVGISKDGTAANTLVFMTAWNVVWKDARYKSHDWIIKADPDAVVIVDRLRSHLRPYTHKNVFIKNCMKFTGPGWPMMFGSLEAFSREAMETYFKGAERCQTELEWQVWGEDLFMGNCLSMLGAHSEFDGGIIGDNVCKGANCADGTTAVYHPFKSTESWFECYNQANTAVFKK